MSSRSRGSAAASALGIAISPVSITACSRSVPTVWRRDLELNGGANGSMELLQAALGEAARAAGAESTSAVVALLSPLVELRTISLPPLSAEDRNRFLSRNASRYFVSARGAQVIGSHAPSAPKGSPSGPVLAAAVGQQLLAALHAAASAANVSVLAVVPAESAWAAAACAIWPALARGVAGVVVTRDDRTDVITLADGSIKSVRRFRGAGDAAVIVASVTSEGAGTRLGVLGPANAARAMTAALSARGARVSTPDAPWQAMAEHPDVLAARFAPEASGLEIRTEESRETERAESGRLAQWVFGAAAALLILAGLVHYQGVKRELASVQAARAAIRPQVEAMLVGRSSVETAYRQVGGLAKISRESPRWSSVLAALAAQLPDAAALTAFRARGDSIFLDGVADQAAPVFDDVARTPGVTGVRATAPVRRESIDGDVPLEHFSIGAQITPRQLPAASPPLARRRR